MKDKKRRIEEKKNAVCVMFCKLHTERHADRERQTIIQRYSDTIIETRFFSPFLFLFLLECLLMLHPRIDSSFSSKCLQGNHSVSSLGCARQKKSRLYGSVLVSRVKMNSAAEASSEPLSHSAPTTTSNAAISNPNKDMSQNGSNAIPPLRKDPPRPTVGPPRPTTANVAPILPPKPMQSKIKPFGFSTPPLSKVILSNSTSDSAPKQLTDSSLKQDAACPMTPPVPAEQPVKASPPPPPPTHSKPSESPLPDKKECKSNFIEKNPDKKTEKKQEEVKLPESSSLKSVQKEEEKAPAKFKEILSQDSTKKLDSSKTSEAIVKACESPKKVEPKKVAEPPRQDVKTKVVIDPKTEGNNKKAFESSKSVQKTDKSNTHILSAAKTLGSTKQSEGVKKSELSTAPKILDSSKTPLTGFTKKMESPHKQSLNAKGGGGADSIKSVISKESAQSLGKTKADITNDDTKASSKLDSSQSPSKDSSSEAQSSPPLKLPDLKPKIAVKRKRASLVSQKSKEPTTPLRESKRSRVQVIQFQSPNPEFQQIIKSLKGGNNKEKPPPKPEATITPVKKSPTSDKYSDAVFFKGEHLAVRNAEGSFYICQAIQNIFRHSKKISIQWLSEAPDENPNKDVYMPEYYDKTDFETILTSVEMEKLDKKRFRLTKMEETRIKNILKKSVEKEEGTLEPNEVDISEDNPDGLDISLYKDEDQLKELERKKKDEEKKKNKVVQKTPRPKTSTCKSFLNKKSEAIKKTNGSAKKSNSKSPKKRKKVIDEDEEDDEDYEVMPTPKKRRAAEPEKDKDEVVSNAKIESDPKLPSRARRRVVDSSKS
ncbi:unnamed protein product [Lepeophtheirus salmonis]|uniref:(salmon louse) hypothetical protein n=1 Tax=Lepeophtheirus salmonis TaxID=72036 RepID=A0A7R8HDJ8_LEPSM|nr:unnamed protein product [Lepeophtheirus salmonis]CAF3012341.1 unnamed protein product [Lepeophtheirus salmonis]